MMNGRHNRYQTIVAPRLETIKYWRSNGLTEKEVAKNLGIALSSLAKYKLTHADFADALKIGKEDADAQVVNAMFKTATGHEITETEFIFDVDPKTGKAASIPSKVKKTIKYIEPKVAAQIFWAKNRLPDRFRDRIDYAHGGANGESLAVGTVILNLGDNGHGPGSAGKPESEGD